MSAQALMESFRTLPVGEKLRLLQEMWDEVAEESQRMPLSKSHRVLLMNEFGNTMTTPKKSSPGKRLATTSSKSCDVPPSSQASSKVRPSEGS